MGSWTKVLYSEIYEGRHYDSQNPKRRAFSFALFAGRLRQALQSAEEFIRENWFGLKPPGVRLAVQ